MESLTRSPRHTSSLRSLQDEVNRLFESIFPTRMNEGEEPASAVWSPRMDLMESDNQYQLRADLPGISKDDVSITVEDRRLTIRGERKEEEKMTAENVLRMERTFGTFYRSLRLPKSVNEDQIKANFSNGVLTVEIPKTEKSKPKKITIS